MRLNYILFAVLLLLVACGKEAIVEQPIDYAQFCTESIVEVYDCGEYVKAVYGNLGGGAIWFNMKTNEEVHCPVVAPDAMSDECAMLLESPPTCSLAFSCPVMEEQEPAEEIVPEETKEEREEPQEPEDEIEAGICTPAMRSAEVCTEEYQPVCAHMKDGSKETFGNACSACTTQEVLTYEEGECADVIPITRDMTRCTGESRRVDTCAAIYSPVCGQAENGTTKTYGNACSACKKEEVVGYKPGVCY